jgi:UDP-N-acetyl-D-glucosamine dehydrogenase
MSVRNKTVAIIGQGYVGLPLAMAAINAGWDVIGIENSPAKYVGISAGISPVEDVPSADIQEVLASGKYRISNSVADVKEAVIVTICVPTPLDADRAPDLSILERAVLDIAPYLSSGTLVINESTSFPGTLREFIAPKIMENRRNESVEIHLAVAPERVNPGDMKWHQKNTPRLVG